MKIPRHTHRAPRNNSTGFALAMTMMFLAIALAAFGSIMYWVSSNAIVTERNNLYVSSQAAAESATEKVLTTMMRDFTYGSLGSTSSYNDLIPNTNDWSGQFSFNGANGETNQTSVVIGGGAWTELPSQFSGLYGYGQNCVITAVATTAGKRYDVPSTVSQAIWFGNIPVFQFAIFYNIDLEINPGAAMTINGRVHSNGDIWATGNSSSSPLTFTANVDASGIVTNVPSPLDPQNSGRRSGNVKFEVSFTQNSDTLSLPIGTSGNSTNPTNVTAILNLPPNNMAAPRAAAYTTNGQVYLYNAVDLVISNSAYGINGTSTTNVLAVYYQNPNRAPALDRVSPDVPTVATVSSNIYTIGTIYSTNISSYTTTSGKGKKKVTTTTYTTNIVSSYGTNVTTAYYTATNYYFYSFVTNVTFYDYREGKTVQAVQVDVGRLNAWLTNTTDVGGNAYDGFNSSGSTSKGHNINSLYVYSSVGLNGATLPAVRVTDGARLPSAGLTVATPLPLYVEGDYNITTDGIHFSKSLGDTTHTVPASLLGDALTVLSSSWSDNYNSGTSVNSRTPVSTCINAATLEGIVPSNGSHYSGGVENFLRLLESWSGSTTLTYNGSIVVMFYSQYATGYWGQGNVYNPPNRQWGFDTNFSDPSKLPPLTPQVKATVRGLYATE